MSKPPIKKRKTDVKEDIGTLQFGDDFNDGPDVEALLNSDVKVFSSRIPATPLVLNPADVSSCVIPLHLCLILCPSLHHLGRAFRSFHYLSGIHPS